MLKKIVTIVAALLITTSGVAVARDTVSIVGSSTVYPFSTTVAENFGNTTRFNTPKVESTGSGGGFKLFCAGVGIEYPDITNASRRIKKSEYNKCMTNGVSEIIEVKVGYDGIVVANSRKAPLVHLDRKTLYLALAKEVPNPDGTQTLVPNPYEKWSDIDSNLPTVKIEVLGPPPTSGTRDAFCELVMEKGAKKFDWLKKLRKEDKKKFKAVAHAIREDGHYIEAGENDNLIIRKLIANPDAFGVFGFSFLDQNTDKIQGSVIEGTAPTFEAIADGSYPVSRPLFFYVKKAHINNIPGMKQYLDEFTSEKAWGPDGYLSEKGMIPMPDAERAKYRNDVKDLKTLSLE